MGALVRYFAIAVVLSSLGGCASSGIIPTGYPDEFFMNKMVGPVMLRIVVLATRV